MTSAEEAKELLKRVEDALGAMERFDEFKGNIKESEVKFRYDAIVGILLMIRNDIYELHNQWK